MGSTFLWHVIADTTANMLAILDEEKSDLWKPAVQFNYQLRTVDSEFDRYGMWGRWPAPKFAAGDPLAGVTYILGQDMSDVAGGYEPSSVPNGGNYRPGYLQGQCTMADGVTALAAAVVELYLTSTRALVSGGITDPNGNYSLPTPFSGQNHYLYANYNNGQFVGTTIDTLIPNA